MKNIITLFLLTALSTSALAFKIPAIPGADSKEEESSSVSAADAQEAIVGDFKAALGFVLQAQGHVAKALGMEDTAESLRAEAGRLSGPITTPDGIELYAVCDRKDDLGIEISRD